MNHEASFLEVKDACKGTGKRNAFDACKSDQTFAKRCTLSRGPLKSPLRLGLNARNGVNRFEQMILANRIFDKRVNQLRVDFAMNVFDRNLKALETTRFGQGHFTQEIESQVFIHNAIRSCEKSQRLLNKMAFALPEVCPILHIGQKIELFRRPKGGLGLFLHLPNVIMLNGQQHEAIWIGPTQDTVIHFY